MRRFSLTGLAAAGLLPAMEGSAADRISVDPSSGRLVDGLGRVRVFHGVNAVFKEWPWLPKTDGFDVKESLAKVDMENLRNWGFNVVRLGVMWPGVEPEPGQIDQGYLQRAVELASQLGQHDVYTLVDLHQDVGSRHFCGEGIPEHYVDALLNDPSSRLSKTRAFPEPWGFRPMDLNATGYPALEDCLSRNFATYYESERVGALFHELYTTGTPLNDGVHNFWSAVAKAFVGQDHVVGYELLNEPAAFCLDGNLPSCLNVEPFLGSGFEDKYLAPFYTGIAEHVRAVDGKTPIFVEPSPYPKLSGHMPFSEPPLKNDTQQVLAYHVYCAPGDQKGVFRDLLCKAAQDIDEHAFLGFLRHFKNVAGFMTEFGAVGQSEGELKHMTRLLNIADTMFQSWAYWQLKLYRDFTTQNQAEPLYDGNGKLEAEKLRTLSRTYAQAIAGSPLKMSFSVEDGSFELDFEVTSAKGPTVIYANKAVHYPDGISLEVTPSDCFQATWVDDNHVELVAVNGASATCSTKLRKVRISKQAAAEATFV